MKKQFLPLLCLLATSCVRGSVAEGRALYGTSTPIYGQSDNNLSAMLSSFEEMLPQGQGQLSTDFAQLQETAQADFQALMVSVVAQKVLQHAQMRVEVIQMIADTLKNNPQIHIFTHDKLGQPEKFLANLHTMFPRINYTPDFEKLVSSMLIARAHGFESVTKGVLTTANAYPNDLVTCITNLNAFINDELKTLSTVAPNIANQLQSQMESSLVIILQDMQTALTTIENHFGAAKSKALDYVQKKFAFINDIDPNFTKNYPRTEKTVTASVNQGLQNIQNALQLLKSEFDKVVALQSQDVQDQLKSNQPVAH